MSHPKLSKSIARMRKDLREKIKVDGMEQRNIVLADALVVEGMIKMMMGPLVSLKPLPKLDSSERIPLSFDQSINLLIYLKVIDKKHRSKLKLFGDIRSQFVHNWEASTFTTCLKFCNRTEDLLKMYPTKDKRLKLEKQLERACKKLGIDVRDIVGDVVDAFLAKAWEHVQNEANKEKIEYTATREATIYALRAFKENLAKMVKKGYTLDEEDVDKLPQWLLHSWDYHFHKEIKSLIRHKKTREQIWNEKQQAKAKNAPA